MNSGDTAWVLICAALVLFMTPGLAFFYGGMVRTKYVMTMLIQNVFAMSIVSLLWVMLAFSLAFGSGGHGIIGGFSYVGLRGIDHATLPGYTGALALSIPALAFFAYQMMFAIITPALITGATADRLKFRAWAVFIALWSVIVYAPIAHWLFSPVGWLAKLGALDFAGGIVVHVSAGAAALAILLVLGPRHGWPGTRAKMRGHSLPLTLLGAGILWFGWFGFNAGSALGANLLAAHALVNTQVAAAAGMSGWLIAEHLKEGHVTTLGGASGAIAGLAAVTPAAGFVGPLPAILIGALAGGICMSATQLKFIFRFDDALDVVGVHLVAGALGSVSVGLFADKAINRNGADGLFLGGGGSLLGLQVLAVAVVFAFAFVMTWIIAKVIDLTIGLRVTAEQEADGTDVSEFLEAAYAP